ncbi:hypothetical protein LCGC14_2473010 [marine sediment metagenome]|uniref:Uncharacterized protein n=1 Tax=marine sediment metagenome TaxID=412755 RepID=A0A0F9BAL4_9ZZZZ
MITKLDEALSICVALGTLTQLQASSVSSVCENRLAAYKSSKHPNSHSYIDALGAVIDISGVLYSSRDEVLKRFNLQPKETT